MNEERPESFEEIASKIAMSEYHDPVRHRAHYWYLVIICLMPMLLAIVLPVLLTELIPLSGIKVTPQIVMVQMSVCLLTTLSSIIVLGYVHARLLDAMYQRHSSQVDKSFRNRVLGFWLSQILITSPFLIKVVTL